MMNRKLTETISMQELQHMREEGMTNRQIAEALDIGYSTVCAYLGRQPKGLRAKAGTYPSKKHAKPAAEGKKAVLRKLSCVEEYEGEENKYIVHRDSGIVNIVKTNCEEASMDKDRLERYITELLDILAML